MDEQVKNGSRFAAKLGFTLFVITSVTALLLAGVNALTKEPIAQLKTEARNEAMQSVMPGSTILEDKTVVNADSTIYTAQRSDGTYGYCVEVAPTGFGGPINMIVGIEITNSGDTPVKRVIGVAIVSMKETAGLGTKAKEGSFVGQFAGKTAGAEAGNIAVIKDGGDIDAISGATITSRAVTKGVNMALDAIKLDAAASDTAQPDETGAGETDAGEGSSK